MEVRLFFFIVLVIISSGCISGNGDLPVSPSHINTPEKIGEYESYSEFSSSDPELSMVKEQTILYSADTGDVTVVVTAYDKRTEIPGFEDLERKGTEISVEKGTAYLDGKGESCSWKYENSKIWVTKEGDVNSTDIKMFCENYNSFLDLKSDAS
jgi:hypothetical protein